LETRYTAGKEALKRTMIATHSLPRLGSSGLIGVIENPPLIAMYPSHPLIGRHKNHIAIKKIAVDFISLSLRWA